MKLKKVKSICKTLLVFFCIFIFLMYLLQGVIFGYIAIGIVVIIGFFIVAFWRCPHCGKRLGQMELGNEAKYCRFCGKEVEL